MVDERTLKKNQIIAESLAKGLKAKDIDKELEKAGIHEKFNPLTYKGNWVNFLPKAWEQTKNIGRDLSTAGGDLFKTLGEPFSNAMSAPMGIKTEVFKQSLGDNSKLKDVLTGMGAGYAAGRALTKIPGPIGKIGGLGGMATGAFVGLAGGPEKFAQTILEPYNLSVQPEIDLAKGLIKTGISKSDIPVEQLVQEYKDKRKGGDIRNVAQGALDNPAYAIMDTAGAWVPLSGRALAKGGAAIQKSKAPLFIKEMLLSPEQRAFNRELTEAMASGKVKASKMYGGYNNLDQSLLANREEIARYIMTNKGNLSKQELSLAKQLKKDLLTAEKRAIKEGYIDPAAAKRNVVSQYVMQDLIGDTNLIQQDIDDILRGNKLRKEAREMITPDVENRIRSLVQEGSDLYDNNRIAYLTQKFASSRDPLGKIIASTLNRNAKDYFETERIIGRSTPKRLGRVLDDSIRFQLDQIGNSTEALDVLNKVLSNKKVTNLLKGTDDIKNKKQYRYDKRNDIFKKFKESISKDIQKGDRPDINKALKASGIQGFMDESYFKAINRALEVPATDKARRVLSSVKKALLTSPHWVILNRIGNMTNNAMAGVEARDYLDAITKYRKFVPRQLKLQTSFSNYVSEGAKDISNGLSSALVAPMNRIKNSIGMFANSEKGWGDIGKLAGGLYSGTSNLLSDPVFKIESVMELHDRYANFIRQARKEAKLRGTSVENILKEADESPALFNKLNTEVNKSLGDYTGRNYFFPSGGQQLLAETIPFYKFIAQTGRTTAHQLAHRPLAFSSLITNPLKYGNELSEETIKEYGLDPKFYKGGVPYATEDDGTTRFLRMEPLPYGAITDQLSALASGDLMGSGLSPLLSAPAEAIMFTKYGIPVETPEYHKLLEEGKYKEAANYKPSPADKYKLGLATLLENSSGTYRMLHNTAPELAATLIPKDKRTGALEPIQGGLHRTYPTAPFTFDYGTYPKQLPVELVGKWFGAQTYPSLRKFSDMYKIKAEQKKATKRTKKIEKYKKPVKKL